MARKDLTEQFVAGEEVILVLLDDMRVVLERRFRYPHARNFIELPAGKCDAGETSEATGRRELLEETGYFAAGELLEVLTLPLAEAQEMVRDGRITNAKTVVGLLWMRCILAGGTTGSCG